MPKKKNSKQPAEQQQKPTLQSLLDAINNNHATAAKQINEISVDLLQVTNKPYKEMPLHLATYKGHKAIIELLLNKTPDLINSTDEVGDNILHTAATTLQQNSGRFNGEGHVVFRKTQHYSNPAIDTICYLSDVYENITPTTTENDACIEAAALIETDLLEDCINGFGDETRYPWSWTRISSELYTPPVMPSARRANTGL